MYLITVKQTKIHLRQSLFYLMTLFSENQIMFRKRYNINLPKIEIDDDNILLNLEDIASLDQIVYRRSLE